MTCPIEHVVDEKKREAGRKLLGEDKIFELLSLTKNKINKQDFVIKLPKS